MNGNERMLRLKLPALPTVIICIVLSCTGRRLEPVNASQAIDDAAHGLREAFIGRIQIGPERITAIRRDRDAAQDGRFRRVNRCRDIGMPTSPCALHAGRTMGLRRSVLGD